MSANNKHEDEEFGGYIGCTIITLVSHMIPYYFWYCLEFANASLVLPSPQMLQTLFANAAPTRYAVQIYVGFIAFEFVLAWILPGLMVKGSPLNENQ